MSYLAMVKEAEAQRAQYRDALRNWWTLADSPAGLSEGERVYQTLVRLLDDLGVTLAHAIREEELQLWNEGRGMTDSPSCGCSA